MDARVRNSNNARYFIFFFLLFLLLANMPGLQAQSFLDSKLYNLNPVTKSRSISFKNPTGEPGKGGTAASEIGVSRKGAPKREIKPGETVTLCNIKGSGTIRHIWITGKLANYEWMKVDEKRNVLLRSVVIQAYWDGQKHPSIMNEAMIGRLQPFGMNRYQVNLCPNYHQQNNGLRV